MSVFLRLAAIGLFAAWTFAAAGIIGPSKAFPHADWFDRGIRLLRDDQEIRYYFDHSTWIGRGAQEYPPLGVVFFSLPRLLTDDFRTFQVLYVLLTSVCYALLMGTTAALLRTLGRQPYLALLFLLPAALYFSLWRFDVFPALLAAMALLALSRGKTAASFLLMFLAVLAKWYAALFFLPLFIFIGSARADRKTVQKAMVALIAAAAATLAAVTLLSGFGALADPVLYHLSRDFEIGALGTAVILGLQKIGIAGHVPHGAVSWLFLIAQFAFAIPLAMYGRIKDMAGTVRACVFLLIPFMVFGHFFSAQWIVWLSPLVVLVAAPAELALLVALDLALFLQFPVLFGINPYSGPFFAVSLARTALLMVMWWRNYLAMRASGSFVLSSMKRKISSAQGVDRT